MTSSPEQPHSTAELNDSIKQIKQQMQAGQIKAADELCQQLLPLHPKHTELVYMNAVCARYSQQLSRALELCQQLQSLAPDFGRAFQEQGHILLAMDKPELALQAYRQAVKLNPALTASWQRLAQLATQAGIQGEVTHAVAHLEHYSALPPILVSINSMLHEGKLQKAEQLCRHYLQANPKDTEAMRLLAQLGMRLNVLDDAEFLLESALEFEPDNRQLLFDHIQVLHRRQKFAQAHKASEKLVSIYPNNPSFDTCHANQCVAIGRYDQALELYDRVIAQLPDNADLYLVRGHALKTVGRQDDAIASYQKAYQLKPAFGDAFWSLANLKTYKFSDDEIRWMQEQLQADSTRLQDKYHLCFALGKGLEDRKQFEEAFGYYHQGNELKRQELRYESERIERDFGLQKQWITPELIADKGGRGNPAPDPIFILGMPRAGSTLIEQIIASHSKVDGTLELPDILAMAHRLNGRRRLDEAPRYPENLTDLSDSELKQLGQEFLDNTRVHRGSAPFFIDKMPNNFRHIGLIKLILPKAKIIDARRAAMACCFSNFKQLFAEGQEFTYGLEQVGRYYSGYVELMDHWHSVFPGEILHVQYEDVVDDLETQVRRILDYLELPFEESCVEFHRTKRSVRTASSEQVRQPIYKQGVDQWVNFEPWLDELTQHLSDKALPKEQ
ncbi:sulfotransferase [Shewanella corallii]|uniref:Sulfotransferase n=1 Tax=Shewanella corallii TaxID=560080 RepID=A0ABT0N2R3_9GAMM|nr:tetratricopeptide repeat-containing sulfotransferase family protein [Shewanella corallii]MCL2912732.1 sulfotransferase [Shewanella corallii]